MIEENLSDEQLLEITGGGAFLDEASLINSLNIIHMRPLYSIYPGRVIALYAVSPRTIE